MLDFYNLDNILINKKNNHTDIQFLEEIKICEINLRKLFISQKIKKN